MYIWNSVYVYTPVWYMTNVDSERTRFYCATWSRRLLRTLTRSTTTAYWSASTATHRPPAPPGRLPSTRSHLSGILH